MVFKLTKSAITIKYTDITLTKKKKHTRQMKIHVNLRGYTHQCDQTSTEIEKILGRNA